MTERDAMALMKGWHGHDFREAQQVAIKRCGAEWQGHVVGVMCKPCLLLDQGDGKIKAIALEDADFKIVDPGERNDG